MAKSLHKTKKSTRRRRRERGRQENRQLQAVASEEGQQATSTTAILQVPARRDRTSPRRRAKAGYH